MLPIVPEVIIVAEASVALLHDFTQANEAGIVLAVASPTIILSVDYENVGVHAFPAHPIWMISCSSAREQSSICTRRQIVGTICSKLILN